MCAQPRSARVESLETRRLLSAVVAFFNNSSYVDTSSSEPAATAANLQQELVQLGYTVKPFTGIDPTSVQQALQGANVLVIPALVNGDLDSAMSNTAKSEIQSFLSGGGGLIVSGNPVQREANFLNDTFDLPLHLLNSAGPSYELNVANAVGTAFAGGASTIAQPTNRAGGVGVPTGALSIYDESSSFGATAVALLPYASRLPIVYLSYDWADGGPNGAFDGGWNQVLNLGIEQLTSATALKGTVTTVVASPTSITVGSLVQLTASVSPATTGGATPTGMVTFNDGSTSLGSAALQSNGTALLSTTSLPVGSDAISASYGGNTNYAGSTSAAVIVSVGSAGNLAASATTLNSSATSVAQGASVTFTATVGSAAGGGPTPTGTVSFLENGNVTLGVATLSGGTAAISTSTLVLGTDTVIATYSGDGNYLSSSAPSITENVTSQAANATVTTLSASATSIVPSTPITFTATVMPVIAGGVTPTGVVTFMDGNAPLATATVGVNGTASFSASSLTAGTHLITASYGGGAGDAASVSSTVSVQVGVGSAFANSVTALSASASSVAAGAAVTFTATVSPAAGSGTPPTGTVYFTDNETTLGFATIQDNGTAVFASLTLPAGNSSVTANYTGDGNYGPSTSAPVAETVYSSVVPSFGKIVLPATAVAGARFMPRLPVVLSNHGNTLRGRFAIQLYASTGTTLDANAVALSTLNSNVTLGRNISKTFIGAIKSLPATLPEGDYYLLIQVVDPTGAVNVTACSTTVQVAAPFVALGASARAVTPAALAVGKWGSILVTVTNDGNENAGGFLDLTLGLSADGQTPLAGEALTTTIKRVTLLPGRGGIYRLRFKVPAAAAGGVYYPFLTASLAGSSTTAAGIVSFTID